MAIQLGRYGIWKRVTDATPELAQEGERLGYGAFWVGGSPTGDLGSVEALLDATKTIPVVTGIVNMWKDDAKTVGASYLRIADRHPGRFLLGVGVGHPEGIPEYTRPIDKVGAYLDELGDMGIGKDALVLAALGPVALRIAAQRTVGAHPYITTPRHTVMAREVMGEGPVLAPEQKVMLRTDAEEARQVVRANADRYLRLTNYRRSFLREGWSTEDLDGGGSDELIDLLGLHGTIERVVAGIDAHLEAGADHVCVQTLGDDPMGQYRALAEALF